MRTEINVDTSIWKFVAQDGDGYLCVYENRPYKLESNCEWANPPGTRWDRLPGTLEPEDNPDWRESLADLSTHTAYLEDGMLKSEIRAPSIEHKGKLLVACSNPIVVVFRDWVESGCTKKVQFDMGTEETAVWADCAGEFPVWNPKYRYRLKPEEQEAVEIPKVLVRTYLYESEGCVYVGTVLKGESLDPRFEGYLEWDSPLFIRWLDKDWVEIDPAQGAYSGPQIHVSSVHNLSPDPGKISL